jgi:hypothetical protein
MPNTNGPSVGLPVRSSAGSTAALFLREEDFFPSDRDSDLKLPMTCRNVGAAATRVSWVADRTRPVTCLNLETSKLIGVQRRRDGSHVMVKVERDLFYDLQRVWFLRIN